MRKPDHRAKTRWSWVIRRERLVHLGANVGDILIGKGRESGRRCRSAAAGGGGLDAHRGRGHNLSGGTGSAYRRSCSALLAGARGIDVALRVDGERRDLLLRRAVEDEALALRRDAVDQAAAVGTGDDIAAVVEVKHANLGLVALEEDAAVTATIDAINLAAIAGADVELTLAVEGERPDVFRLWVEKDTGRVAGIDGDRGARLFAFRAGLGTLLRGGNLCRSVRSFRGLSRSGAAVDDLVYLAIGRRCGINGTGGVDDHRLHLQLLRREDDAGLAIGRQPVDAGRRSGSRIDVALRIRGDIPQIG